MEVGSHYQMILVKESDPYLKAGDEGSLVLASQSASKSSRLRTYPFFPPSLDLLTGVMLDVLAWMMNDLPVNECHLSQRSILVLSQYVESVSKKQWPFIWFVCGSLLVFAPPHLYVIWSHELASPTYTDCTFCSFKVSHYTRPRA